MKMCAARYYVGNMLKIPNVIIVDAVDKKKKNMPQSAHYSKITKYIYIQVATIIIITAKMHSI